MHSIDSKASVKLVAVVANTRLCKDIGKLSPSHQTSCLESFHSVIIHFAPKFVALSYLGMQCRCNSDVTNTAVRVLVIILILFFDRLQIAALHFNENAGREQSTTKIGEKQYNVVFPKYKRGGYIVRKVLVDPTYGKQAGFKQITPYKINKP